MGNRFGSEQRNENQSQCSGYLYAVKQSVHHVVRVVLELKWQ